jgi:cytochrome b561
MKVFFVFFVCMVAIKTTVAITERLYTLFKDLHESVGITELILMIQTATFELPDFSRSVT